MNPRVECQEEKVQQREQDWIGPGRLQMECWPVMPGPDCQAKELGLNFDINRESLQVVD